MYFFNLSAPKCQTLECSRAPEQEEQGTVCTAPASPQSLKHQHISLDSGIQGEHPDPAPLICKIQTTPVDKPHCSEHHKTILDALDAFGAAGGSTADRILAHTRAQVQGEDSVQGKAETQSNT